MVCAVLYAFVAPYPAIGQDFKPVPERPRAIEQQGSPLGNDASDAVLNYQLEQLKDIQEDLPVAELTRISKLPISETSSQARSAKGAQLYRTTSPSVVLIATKRGLHRGL